MKITFRLPLLAVSLVMAACNTQVASMVRVTDVPAGSACPTGGVSIETGFDKNGNGVLDDGEVDATKTKILCNGTPGMSGANGMNGATGDAGVHGPAGTASLTKVTSEPAGANCKYGGARVDTGPDTNGDGVLETTEITATQYVCDPSTVNAWYFGDVHIAAPGDLAVLDGIQVIIGSLYFDAPFGTDVTLPDLQVVTASVYLTQGNGGGGKPVHGPGLVGLNSLTFPALTRVGDSVYLQYQESITTFAMPKLTTTTYVAIQYNDLLTTVDFSSLVSVPNNTLDVGYNPALTTLTLTKLASLDTLNVQSNAALPALALPALTTLGSLSVNYNDALASLTVPKLTTLNTLTIVSNQMLVACPFYHLAITPRPSANIVNDADTCTAFDVCDVLPIPGITATVRSCRYNMGYDSAQALCRTVDALPDGGSSIVDGGLGSNLMWFESEDEWFAFRGSVLDGGFGNRELWLGYSDRVAEGTWLAESGFTSYTPMSDPDAGFWAQGEPNNSGGAENWSELYPSGVANDTVDTNNYFPVCRTP